MILVTAASGRLGRAAAEALAARVEPSLVRLAARSPQKLDDLKARGFEVVGADYEDRDALSRAFDGIETALVISSMGPNDVRAAHHQAAIDAAKTAGTRHLVYTSAVHATPSSRFEWAPAHAATEAALKASGLGFTILRDNSYAANNDGLYRNALETGVFAVPGVGAKVAYVTHEDVAAAAAGVITGSGHDGKTYEMTGPEALDGHAVAERLATVAGRPVRAEDMPLEAYAAMLRSFGLPEFVVTGVTSFMAALAAGEYASVSGDVERLAGRPATPLAAYLRGALAA
jgi:NAD(P)H dehydrogenase (quinone)